MGVTGLTFKLLALKAITKAVLNGLYGCYGNLSACKNDDNMLTNARVLVLCYYCSIIG